MLRFHADVRCWRHLLAVSALALLLPLELTVPTAAHEGPDPLAHWIFTHESARGEKIVARIGPDLVLARAPHIVSDELGESLRLASWDTPCVVAKNFTDVPDILPQEAMVAAAWVTVDRPQEWGGIVGTIQDNDDAETGWLLGYNEQVFTFALASEGGDDGNGRLTYLAGQTTYEPGKWYHVVAVYDGQTMELYVNGELDATRREQSGPILYPRRAPLVIGGYQDLDESYVHEGRIREVSLYDLAAKAAWVRHDFEDGQRLTELPPPSDEAELGFLVKPYLQFGTKTSMTVMWHTTATGSSTVHYGETIQCRETAQVEGTRALHEVRLEGLEPETQYFYRVETLTESGARIVGDTYTFTTAVRDATPYAFAAIGDTQGNPEVSDKLCRLAWAQRPSFVIHAGDLVDTGSNPDHWTQHFFPGMHELISRVPLFPVLGNHEEDSPNFYNYMALPPPEYFYEFRYGNAHFFMIDSNRNVGPGSEQFEWLDKVAADSDATWKFACHHHPPYSSDENDYGDLWKTNKSTHGDARVRQLSPLYEKHGIDIVWNGHIHSYERTWPVLENKAVERDAPIYLVTGGGGGSLETAGPTRPFFQNHVRHGHHYAMVHINGRTLEFRAYTEDDRLFDTVTIRK